MSDTIDEKIMKKVEQEIKKSDKSVTALDAPGAIDVLADGDKLVYLLASGQVVSDVSGVDMYIPPSKEDVPYLLPDKDLVLKFIKKNNYATSEADSNLYEELLTYHKGVSDLPHELYYDLLVLWDFHTYLPEKIHYSPILYLYAVRERGKSRTARGCLFVARRGIFTESIREPDIIRWGNDHKAALGFDAKDFPKKIQRANCDDLILARFERGSISSRTLWPEKGPFKDTKNFKLFGPTIVCTNRPVDDILESRCINIDMKPTSRIFNRPVAPEDALELKAKLTAFRLAHKDTQLLEPDRLAPGRLGDILSSLANIVYTLFPHKIESFKALVSLIIDSKKEQALDSMEAQIVEAVIKADGMVEKGFLATDAISNLLNEGKDPRFTLDNRVVGRILKGLGFTGRKTTGGERGIYYDPEFVKTIASQYGLEDLGISITTPLMPLSPETEANIPDKF